MPSSAPTPRIYVPSLLAAAAMSCLVPSPYLTNEGAEQACGDGLLDADEECDLGSENRDDGPCTSTCTVATCGDGLLYAGVELCDDGNATPGDGCSQSCSDEEEEGSCGDGVVEDGELCDDGNTVSGDGCSAACVLENCGDGVVDGGEECDDGNDDDGDGCTSLCKHTVCGDALVQAGVEECDDANDDDTDSCLNNCRAAVCGDGVIWTGVEECDDGNDVNTDACPSSCQTAKCGDGIVWAGEEECDDGNNDDSDACRTTCAVAECGDGVVWDGLEACDDGNDIETDACLSTCMPAACGDGIRWTGEEDCDDGNLIELDGCTSDCEVNGNNIRRVFVTSTRHTGALGGVAGADQICNALAQAANLPGDYMAWISTDVNNVPITPDSRFNKSMVPYYLVDGTKIADNYTDLTDGSLDHAIDLTELGQPSPATAIDCNGNRVVRTGTAPDGTLAIARCNNFTQTMGSLGTIGSTTATDGTWSECGANIYTCATLAPIYCFQQ